MSNFKLPETPKDFFYDLASQKYYIFANCKESLVRLCEWEVRHSKPHKPLIFPDSFIALRKAHIIGYRCKVEEPELLGWGTKNLRRKPNQKYVTRTRELFERAVSGGMVVKTSLHPDDDRSNNYLLYYKKGYEWMGWNRTPLSFCNDKVECMYCETTVARMSKWMCEDTAGDFHPCCESCYKGAQGGSNV